MTNSFMVATWNMGGGEPNGGPSPAATERVLSALQEAGCSIILGQEAQEQANREILEGLGYAIAFTKPESLVAYLPDVWTAVAAHDEVLNPSTPYFRRGGTKPVFIHAARAILCDQLGRSVEALSYHLPSAVQQLNPPRRRVEALHESMQRLSELADESQASGVLFGGDDNVDEFEGVGSWAFMLRAATGLRQLRAPTNTLGRRKVDDFRIARLVVKGDGKVVEGPTDHNAHIRRLAFRPV